MLWSVIIFSARCRHKDAGGREKVSERETQWRQNAGEVGGRADGRVETEAPPAPSISPTTYTTLSTPTRQTIPRSLMSCTRYSLNLKTHTLKTKP